MNKVAFHTLGCKLNFAETSSISKIFINEGFKKVELEDQPDVFIINTCSVTENADKKCHKIVQNCLKYSPHSYIIITGCYAQLKPKEISNIPGVDAVLGSNEKFKISNLIKDFKKGSQTEIHVSDINTTQIFNSAYSENDRTRTFLKIQDGCNYYCSFCTFPYARGRSRSDTIENIINNINEIIDKGNKEIVLTGVNIGDFGIVNGKRNCNFLDLIKEIERLKKNIRIRISSVEPNLLDNEIIEIISKSSKFMPHFHMPLQSGNNAILKSMRRRYLRELYEQKVNKIKNLMPHACIGVDIITGFPGETKEHFTDTYNFLKDLDCNYLHVFPYSERANTRALSMDNIVPLKARITRAKMLRILSEKKKRLFYEDNIGIKKIVLFEQENIDGKMLGYTDNYIRVIAKYEEKYINNLLAAKLTKIDDDGYMEIDFIK